MQDSTFLPQHRVSALALSLTLSAATLGALGCAHSPAPEHQARVETTEAREPQRTQVAIRQEPVRVEATPIAQPERMDNTEEPGPATAMDQSNEPADLEITRRIRAAVVTDAALSVGARNCTIVTRDAIVTLRGNVSQQERTRIAAHAQAVPGVTRIENLLAANP